MPIRFRCQRCQKLLAISARKAGSEIQCPKCGATQRVPPTDTADASAATAPPAPPPPASAAPASTAPQTPEVLTAVAVPSAPAGEGSADSSGELTFADEEPLEAELLTVDIPPAVPLSPATPVVAPPVAPSAPAALVEAPPLAPDLSALPPTEAAAPAGTPVPADMILYRRRTLYIHAALFAVVAVFGFAAGYWIGRGDVGRKLGAEQEEAARDRIIVDGTLTIDAAADRQTPDEGAAVILLREGKSPGKPLAAQGLRPQDSPPGEFQRNVRIIRESGGDYTRANAEGKFSVVVPEPGRYHLLIISRHAVRAKHRDIEEVDQTEIGRFFESPTALLGQQQYRWLTTEITRGFNPIEIQFSGDGKD